MSLNNFDFIRTTKTLSGSNFGIPTVIYELQNRQDQKLIIELKFLVNATITINDKTFTIGPPTNKVSFGQINILNDKQNEIGYVDYYGWTFKSKKVVLLPSELVARTEEWTIDNKLNIFSKKFWTNSELNFEIANGQKKISFLKLRQRRSWKKVLEDTKNELVKITTTGEIDAELFLIAVVIYLAELIEANKDN